MLVQYDPILIVLSVAVAIMGSFTGFVLTSGTPWLKAAPPKLRILKGAITIGGGIWSMHFIGMMAVKLPVTVSYDVLLTLISAFTAILVTGLALYVCSYRPSSVLCIVVGGIFMGSGIAGMHYVGMSAIRGPCILSYSQLGVVISVIIAIGASMGALWLAFRRHGMWKIALGSASLGLTISAMHYVGMFATNFIPVLDVIEIATPVFTSDFMASIVAIASFVFFGLFLLMALPDNAGEEPGPEFPAGRATGETGPPLRPRGFRQRIPVEKNGATLFLDPQNIWSVSADGHYSIITDEDTEYFCDMSISKIESVVKGSGLIRSHRSFLVNLNHVKAFSREGDRGLLILNRSNETRIPVSRSKVEIIRRQLETGLDAAELSYG